MDDAFFGKLTANIRRTAGHPGPEKRPEELETAYIACIFHGTGKRDRERAAQGMIANCRKDAKNSRLPPE